MIKITNAFELGKYVTFELSRDKPIYNWFYYKEAFSPELVEHAFKRENIREGAVFDPFAGIGTTLLTAKRYGLPSFGVDASPLAAFISRTKCDNYDEKDIWQASKFIETVFAGGQREPGLKWDFELFSPRAAFPKSNLNAILHVREQLETLEEKPRNLMLLALLSALPLCSLIIKDGGVLKIEKKKRAMPVKDAFRRKARSMLTDLGRAPATGLAPTVILGDARRVPEIENDSISLAVTSPPYLNNIDYSKVYGLELSLMELDKSVTARTRLAMVRSFITSQSRVDEMPPEVGGIGHRIPVIGTYFSDMEAVLKELHRVFKPGKTCYFNVSNSIIHDTHVLVDEVIAEMAQRIGFENSEILVCLERMADVRPKRVKTRESIVVFRK